MFGISKKYNHDNKKHIIMALLLLMVLSILLAAGCSNGSLEEDPTTGTAQSTSENAGGSMSYESGETAEGRESGQNTGSSEGNGNDSDDPSQENPGSSSNNSSGGARMFSLRDVKYGDIDDDTHTLDLMFKADGVLKPVMLIVHGGSYISGDKDEMISYQRYYSQDYVTVSINYPLLPDTTFVAQYRSVEYALAFVAEHAEELRADMNRVVLLGFSAGGQLAVRASEEIALRVAEGEDVGYNVIATIDISGPTDQESLKELADPVIYEVMMSHSELVDGIAGLDTDEEARKVDCTEHIIEGMAPVLIIHGSEDEKVNPIISQRFYEALVEKGISCKLKVFEGEPHSVDLRLVIPEVNSFLQGMGENG